MDESLRMAIKLSEEQAKKDQFMASMNSTAGFQMALKMSEAGTFGEMPASSKPKKAAPTRKHYQDSSDDEDEQMRRAIEES